MDICSVPRPNGEGYDYYETRQAPKSFASPVAAGPGLAALADSLPALPTDATPAGSGAVARGVMCSGGLGSGEFGFWHSMGANIVAGLLLYWLLR